MRGLLSLPNDTILLIQEYVCGDQKVVLPSVRPHGSGCELEGSQIGQELRRAEYKCGMTSRVEEHPLRDLFDYGVVSSYVMDLESDVCRAIQMEVKRNVRNQLRLVCKSFGYLETGGYIVDPRCTRLTLPGSGSRGFVYTDTQSRAFLFNVRYHHPFDDQTLVDCKEGDSLDHGVHRFVCPRTKRLVSIGSPVATRAVSGEFRGSRVLYAVHTDDGPPVYGECELHGIASIPIELYTNTVSVSLLCTLTRAWRRAVSKIRTLNATEKRVLQRVPSYLIQEADSAVKVVYWMVQWLVERFHIKPSSFCLDVVERKGGAGCGNKRRKRRGHTRRHKRARVCV